MFGFKKKNKDYKKVSINDIASVSNFLDDFGDFLTKLEDKENIDTYGKGYNVAIQRIRENYWYLSDDIKYLLVRNYSK